MCNVQQPCFVKAILKTYKENNFASNITHNATEKPLSHLAFLRETRGEEAESRNQENTDTEDYEDCGCCGQGVVGGVNLHEMLHINDILVHLDPDTDGQHGDTRQLDIQHIYVNL